MLYYSYVQTSSLILLYCWYSYCVSFCSLLDGVCLSVNKRITYLLTYLRTYLLKYQVKFAEDKGLVCVVLCEKCEIVQL